jgi:pyrroline-5-carboxylate reductase
MSKTHLRKVSIVGTGKGAEALSQGLLNAGFSNHEVEVVRREELKPDSDFSFFYSKKIKVRKCIQTISRSRHIFLLVTPSGAGETIERISEVKFCHKLQYDIISWISGLESYIIEKHLPVYQNISWTYATYNINIAYNKGIICATEHIPIFDELGFFVKEDFEGVQKSIITVGTMNALLAKGILIAYMHDSYGLTLRDWIAGLYEVILDPVKLNQNQDEYYKIFSYCLTLAEVLTRPIVFYQYDYASNRVKLAMKSLLTTLLSIEDLTEGTLSYIITRVATKGGCTEKGVNELRYYFQLTDCEYLENKIFIPIVLTASKFPSTVACFFALSYES